MTSLAGQRVLVVGGARDIGLAVAEAAAAAGATAIVGARNGDRAKAAAAGIEGAESVVIDITDECSIVSALKEVGSVDHIVVTTSAHHNALVPDLDHDKTQLAFEAKVIGPLMLAKHAASILPPSGSIVLFSGVAAWNPDPGYAIMGIANGAVAFTVEHLAKELAPIRVNGLSPGVVDSGSWDSMGKDSKHQFLDSAAEGTLVGRTGVNADIADGVIWLLSAGFVNGETIHIEGGARHA